MKEPLKIILPVILSVIVLVWGLQSEMIGEGADVPEKSGKIIKLFPAPDTFTIPQYQDSDVENNLQWYWGDGTYKFLKTEKIYGIFRLVEGQWHRSGRWYFYDDKKIVKSTSFLAGKKNGIEYFYNRNGFLKRHNAYKNGVLHGESVKYTSKGNRGMVLCYEEGEFVECPRPIPRVNNRVQWVKDR